jgi:hypothetical protein
MCVVVVKQEVDILTKPLGRIKFQGYRIDIRILDHANNNED